MVGRRLPPLLLAAGFALLAVAWAVTNPPGSAPDERAHYVKAVAAGRGQLLGRPMSANDHFSIDTERFFATIPDEATRDDLHHLFRRFSRVVTIPGSLSPPDAVGCAAGFPDRSYECLNGAHGDATRSSVRTTTYLGTYQPFVYVIPGLAARFARSPMAGFRLARLGNVAGCVALIAVGLSILWSSTDGAFSLTGAVVALTPMVVFSSAVVSTSGYEIAAAFCLIAVVLRAAAGDGRYALLAGAGFVSALVLALTRGFGPVYIAVIAALFVALVTPRAVIRVTRRRWQLVASSAAAVSAACGLCVWWQLRYQPNPPVTASSFGSNLSIAVGDLQGIYHTAIGHFGSLDALMPRPAHLAWSLMLLALILLALLVGTRRQRVILLAIVGTVIGFALAESIFVAYPMHAKVQGRWLLPIAIAVPLYAGEIVRAGRDRLGDATPRYFGVYVAAVAASVQLLGFLANGRRAAVGSHGPIMFIGRGRWSPPAGWAAWTAVAAAGAAAIVAAALITTRPPRETAGA